MDILHEENEEEMNRLKEEEGKENIWDHLPRSPLSVGSLLHNIMTSTLDPDDRQPVERALTRIRSPPSYNSKESSRALISTISMNKRTVNNNYNIYKPVLEPQPNLTCDSIDWPLTVYQQPQQQDQQDRRHREQPTRRSKNRNSLAIVRQSSELSLLNLELPPPPPSPSTILGIESKDQALLELTNRTNYSILQRNGQRIYGGPPPDWKGPDPPRGSEVFVAKVPEDCFEDELVPVFEKMGKIYALRLMMYFSGLNRGFLFVRYTNPQDAKRAIRELNNYQIRPNHHIGVVPSIDNCKLVIRGIPDNCTADDIKGELEKLTEGIQDLTLVPVKVDRFSRGNVLNQYERGYFFIEYKSHSAAALARQKLAAPARFNLLGMEVSKVDWAQPETEVDEETLAQVRVLFIRNLSPMTTELELKTIFSHLSNGQVERVKKTYDYALVNFITREGAERAYSCSKDLVVGGSMLDVVWFKPVPDFPDKKSKKPFCNRGKPEPGHQAHNSYRGHHQAGPRPQTRQLRAISKEPSTQAGFNFQPGVQCANNLIHYNNPANQIASVMPHFIPFRSATQYLRNFYD